MSEHSSSEHRLRRELAAAYRLSAHFGWMDTVFNHISVRLPDMEGGLSTYLVNPEGYLSEEITPGRLLKIDVEGKVLDQPEASFIPAGFTIHSAIHLNRDDAACIMHNHARAGMIVSAMEEKLLPLNQIAMEFYNRVAYHEFGGIALNLDDRERIVQDLGAHKAMIMKHHGLLTVGNSVAEAFYYMYYLHETCEVQVRTLACTDRPLIPPHEVCEFTAKQYDKYHEGDVDKLWEAMLRMLDRLYPGWDEDGSPLAK